MIIFTFIGIVVVTGLAVLGAVALYSAVFDG